MFDKWLYGGIWKQTFLFMAFTIFIFFIFAIPIEHWLLNDNELFQIEGESRTLTGLWQLYYLFADAGNQMSIPWSSSLSRGIGLFISTLGSILLSGLLISTITNGFERRAERFRTGFSYYRLKNHIVIIGSDHMVHAMVNQLSESTDNMIVVMTSSDVEEMRNSIYATLKNKGFQKNIIVNYGQRDSENYLNNINIAYAKEVYILGDTSEFDEIESFHDSLNVQCLTLIAKLCKKQNREKLPCHVLFDYKTTFHVFQYAELSPEVASHIDFHPFNFYDFWSRKVLVAGYSKEENIRYKPLDYIPITNRESDKYVHLIIIGMSKMGQAMALQAAHIAHFPNYKKRKTKITFIDRNGRVEMDEFKQKCGELFKVSHSTFIDADEWYREKERITRESDCQPLDKEAYTTRYGVAEEYKHIGEDGNKEFIDIEWEFIKGNDHNPIVQQILKDYITDNAIITVAVCLNLTHISLRSAMHLPKEYYEKEIPILVQQRKTSTIAFTLNGKGFDKEKRDTFLYRNITPFGMVYDCYDLHLTASVEICKRIAATYEHYFTYNVAPACITPAEANRAWDNTSIIKRWSNIFAAASIPTKLRCIGVEWDINSPHHLADLTEEEVTLLAEIEHNRWNVEELLLGYRPVKQEEDKMIDEDITLKKEYKKRYIHYDIRPFDKLKADDSGRKANVYDEVIVKSLPLILNHQTDSL